MRFCYIGHSSHGQSALTLFFLQVLREIGEVDIFASDPAGDVSADDDLVLQLAHSKYDAYLFLRTEHIAERLGPVVPGRFVIVPMYDAAADKPDAFWQQFPHACFISFCRTHHEHLEAIDCRSASFQYVPEPKSVPTRDFAKPDAFFWERRPDSPVNLGLVLDLCRLLRIGSLHVHVAPDASRSRRSSLRATPLKADGIAIHRSDWFERPEDYEAAAARPLFFFAPRLRDGIGAATLKAMSLGQIVIAPDHPPFNEVLAHGTTGILYDPARPAIDLPLDASALERMSFAARQRIEFGHADWCADVERLKSLLLNDGKRWSTSDVSSHFANALRREASARAFGSHDLGGGKGRLHGH